MGDEIDAIVRGLTESECYVISAGTVWSGTQRSRLIAKGIAPETCRGAPPFPKQRGEMTRYALPLTELGLAVRARLMEKPNA